MTTLNSGNCHNKSPQNFLPSLLGSKDKNIKTQESVTLSLYAGVKFIFSNQRKKQC